MNKKFFISTVVVFIAMLVLGFLVHGMLLKGDYAQFPNLYRPDAEMQNYCLYLFLGQFIMSGAMVWVYRRGKEAKPYMAQGLRYGVVLSLLISVPMSLIYYAVQPLTLDVSIKFMVSDIISNLILGVIIARLEK